MTVSILTPEDWKEWREIRLEALQVDPIAFTESYDTQIHKPDAEWIDDMRRSTLFVWRDEAGIIGGTLGFYVLPNPKVSHRGNIFAVYVRESHRRRGIASRLMQAAIDHAQGRVTQIHLAVDSKRDSAKALYSKYGFKEHGFDPNAIIVDGVAYDEYMMVKIL